MQFSGRSDMLKSILLAKAVERATPHRRLYPARYRPTFLDMLDLAAYAAAMVVAVVAFRVLVP